MKHFIDYNDVSTLPPVNREVLVWHRLYGHAVQETQRKAVLRHTYLGKPVFLARDIDGLFTQRIHDVFAWEEIDDA